jgi:SAM-dependent methyltransferase
VYDELGSDYDRFVNWPSRLALELPFLERELRAVSARRVLDVACGSGQHAIALAERGYELAGADLSPVMIDLAKRNAASDRLRLRFEVAGFGAMHERMGVGYDALLCLGNSLPHLLDPETVLAALTDMAACLRPGGLLVIQNRNFDRVVARRERWMEPQSHREADREWLFLRFYDWEAGGLIGLNMITLRRDGAGEWQQLTSRTQLRPQLRDELATTTAQSGFSQVRVFGDLMASPFDRETSGNLVLVARRASL